MAHTPDIDLSEGTLLNYETVIQDSGATDHMNSHAEYLYDMEEAYHTVILHDNHANNVEEQGTANIVVFDRIRQASVALPLVNTLVVPGLAHTLWSVLAFMQHGHQIIFDQP